MFSLSELKQTRFYQEAKEEGRQEGIKLGREGARREAEQRERLAVRLEIVPKLLALGLTVEQIAQGLDLDVSQVEAVTQ